MMTKITQHALDSVWKKAFQTQLTNKCHIFQLTTNHKVTDNKFKAEIWNIWQMARQWKGALKVDVKLAVDEPGVTTW